jgi:RNA polymerase sigma-70 factor (ECF subfamily)
MIARAIRFANRSSPNLEMISARSASFIFFKISSREEAEDIASDTFLKAWHYLTAADRERKVQHFSGFIYQIARNKIIDVYRDRAKRQDVALEVVTNDTTGDVAGASETMDQPHDRLDQRQEVDHMLTTLKRLKQEYQEVILLRYVDELSIAEISAVMGKGQTAVRVTLHRALQKLRELSAIA